MLYKAIRAALMFVQCFFSVICDLQLDVCVESPYQVLYLADLFSLGKYALFCSLRFCKAFPRICQCCNSLVADRSQFKSSSFKDFANGSFIRIWLLFWRKPVSFQLWKFVVVTLFIAPESLINVIITISVMTWLWHHLSHFLIWVIAFYILHAHQMLTDMKIWNIALTWRSGSTLHLRLMFWAEMSFLAGSSLFHTSPRQAPFTWTFTEAVQFKRGTQGQNIGIVTQVMSHSSLWSSLYTTLQRQSHTAHYI